ncbi:hypothetical protein P886_4830 [Alteromonadaceae bacterium 2753L.S.0a.02]|nr:hypothetical protein P886_4830 [Alteromonadaceae bacterium 2753L.S.0a.02]
MKKGLGLAVMMVFTTLSGAALAGSDSKASKAPYGPARFEEIPGSDLKRVILDEKSVQRLGIETGEVSQKNVPSRQLFGGSIVMPVVYQEKKQTTFGGFGGATPSVASFKSQPKADPNFLWLQITLSEPEWQRISQEKQIRVIPLDTRDGKISETTAVPAGLPPALDPKRTMLRVYYKIADTQIGYHLHDRVRVEMVLKDDNENHMVVPYDAVHYDSKGKSWVYSNPQQYVFERKPVAINRVVGEFAVLDSGPAIGTSVVTVGAALLYGAEVVFKK